MQKKALKIFQSFFIYFFFLQTCEGLHKASVRPHIQGYDLSNYGVFLNFLGPSPTNSNHSTGAGAETTVLICL